MEKSLGVLVPLLRRPLLTADEERQLAHQMRQGGQGAVEARERLIESNIGLVITIARSFNLRQVTDDLIAEGMVGLIKAVERFDPGKGIRFSTYATWWIKCEIARSIDEFYNLRNVARLPVYVVDIIRHLEKLEVESPELKNDIEALTIKFRIRRETIGSLLFASKGGFTALSLDSPVSSESGTLLKELVPEKEEADERKELVDVLLGHLTKREAMILRYHYLDEKSLSEIAVKLKISIGYVRNIRDRARQKLQDRYPSIAKVVLDP